MFHTLLPTASGRIELSNQLWFPSNAVAAIAQRCILLRGLDAGEIDSVFGVAGRWSLSDFADMLKDAETFHHFLVRHRCFTNDVSSIPEACEL